MEPLQIIFYDIDQDQSNAYLTRWDDRHEPPRKGDYIDIDRLWEVWRVVWRSSSFVDVYCSENPLNF